MVSSQKEDTADQSKYQWRTRVDNGSKGTLEVWFFKREMLFCCKFCWSYGWAHLEEPQWWSCGLWVSLRVSGSVTGSSESAFWFSQQLRLLGVLRNIMKAFEKRTNNILFQFLFQLQKRAGSLILYCLSYKFTVSTTDNVIVIIKNLCFCLIVDDSFFTCWSREMSFLCTFRKTFPSFYILWVTNVVINYNQVGDGALGVILSLQLLSFTGIF